jgi:hypothetical protein
MRELSDRNFRKRDNIEKYIAQMTTILARYSPTTKFSTQTFFMWKTFRYRHSWQMIVDKYLSLLHFFPAFILLQSRVNRKNHRKRNNLFGVTVKNRKIDNPF